jgi:hypothetical protein
MDEVRKLAVGGGEHDRLADCGVDTERVSLMARLTERRRLTLLVVGDATSEGKFVAVDDLLEAESGLELVSSL